MVSYLCNHRIFYWYWGKMAHDSKMQWFLYCTATEFFTDKDNTPSFWFMGKVSDCMSSRSEVSMFILHFFTPDAGQPSAHWQWLYSETCLKWPLMERPSCLERPFSNWWKFLSTIGFHTNRTCLERLAVWKDHYFLTSRVVLPDRFHCSRFLKYPLKCAPARWSYAQN